MLKVLLSVFGSSSTWSAFLAAVIFPFSTILRILWRKWFVVCVHVNILEPQNFNAFLYFPISSNNPFQNPAKYCLAKIAKIISTNEVKLVTLWIMKCNWQLTKWVRNSWQKYWTKKYRTHTFTTASRTKIFSEMSRTTYLKGHFVDSFEDLHT